MVIDIIIGTAIGVALAPFVLINAKRRRVDRERTKRILSSYAAECANKGYGTELSNNGLRLVVKFPNGEDAVRLAPQNMDLEAFLATLELPDLTEKK